MATPPNGTHVTWRELELALAPLTSAVEDIQQKVNVLTGDWFEGIGAEREQRKSRDTARFWINVMIALIAGAGGSWLIILVSR